MHDFKALKSFACIVYLQERHTSTITFFKNCMRNTLAIRNKFNLLGNQEEGV
jgi:hypothetical protein